MKRLVLSSALLVCLLAGTALNARVLDRLTDSLSEQLGQAQVLAEQDRWAQALFQTRSALERWEDHSLYLYVVTRHGDADQIRQGLETAVRLLEHRSMAEYAHVNSELMVRLALLAEAEQPTLTNIL